MARRRRRFGGGKTPNPWFIIAQIVVLVALLIAIIEVRDSIADGTSIIVESLTGEDVAVQQRHDPDYRQTDFPGSRTDDTDDPLPDHADEDASPSPSSGIDAGDRPKR